MHHGLIVFIALIALIVIWWLFTYNRLVSLREQFRNAWEPNRSASNAGHDFGSPTWWKR